MSAVAGYCCPGESYPISRAVHLARLASFYPACRGCRHRHDTGALSPETVEQLAEVHARRPRVDFFDDEGLSGVEFNELDARIARQAAVAFGTMLCAASAGAVSVVLGGDGRPLGAELVEATAEGLRRAGCEVVEIGASTSASLAVAMEHLVADGGLLVGNAAGQPHTASLRFWSRTAGPLSRGAGLEVIQAGLEIDAETRGRRYGTLRRFSAESLYLEPLQESFHALRPLRIGLRCASRPVRIWAAKLSRQAACRFFTPTDHSPEAGLHGSVSIDGDGERLWVYDEQGRPVDGERLTVAMARALLQENPGRTVVLEEDASPESERCIVQSGGRAVRSSSIRAAVDAAMRENDALLAGGTSGRFWFAGARPLPDALRGLALLLSLLSTSDRPLSALAFD